MLVEENFVRVRPKAQVLESIVIGGLRACLFVILWLFVSGMVRVLCELSEVQGMMVST